MENRKCHIKSHAHNLISKNHKEKVNAMRMLFIEVRREFLNFASIKSNNCRDDDF
jgi:hypothetical protein